MKKPTDKLSTFLGHNNPQSIRIDSKVEEDIYRAKKFLLKKNGHWD